MFPRRRTGAEARSARLDRVSARGGPGSSTGAADPRPPEPGDRLVPAARRASAGGHRALGRDLHRPRRPARATGGRPGVRWRARPGGARQRAFPLSGYEIGARPARRRRRRCGAENPGRGRCAAAAGGGRAAAAHRPRAAACRDAQRARVRAGARPGAEDAVGLHRASGRRERRTARPDRRARALGPRGASAGAREPSACRLSRHPAPDRARGDRARGRAVRDRAQGA